MTGIIITSIRRIVRAFREGVEGLFRMATAQNSAKLTFEEVYADTISRLEKLQRRQNRILELLREAVERNKGMDEVRKQIDEI